MAGLEIEGELGDGIAAVWLGLLVSGGVALRLHQDVLLPVRGELVEAEAALGVGGGGLVVDVALGEVVGDLGARDRIALGVQHDALNPVPLVEHPVNSDRVALGRGLNVVLGLGGEVGMFNSQAPELAGAGVAMQLVLPVLAGHVAAHPAVDDVTGVVVADQRAGDGVALLVGDRAAHGEAGRHLDRDLVEVVALCIDVGAAVGQAGRQSLHAVLAQADAR